MTHLRQYRRHLPHQVPEGYPIFLTWNLKGSLPRSAIEAIEIERARLEARERRKGESDAERQLRIAKLLFVQRDTFLAKDCQAFARTENAREPHVNQDDWTYDDRPMWLADPHAACEVAKSFIWGVPERYDLWAFAVMGNHAHGLLTPRTELRVVTQGIKGFTAHQINLFQNQHGRVFWQDESFDRWPRDEDEFRRIIQYIEQNPVVAGLCQQAEQWAWSSAAIRRIMNWPLEDPFPVEGKDAARRWLESQINLGSLVADAQAGKPDVR